MFCEQAYVEYTFFGETFTTEVVEQSTFSPTFNYKFVHHVPLATEDFLKFLKGSMEMHVHVTQHVNPPPVGDAATLVGWLVGGGWCWLCACTTECGIFELPCSGVVLITLCSQNKIGTTNEIVAESILTGVAQGYKHSDAIKPKSDADIKCEDLSKKVHSLQEENAVLRQRIEELELRLHHFEPHAKSKLEDAILKDNILNADKDDEGRQVESAQ